MFATLPWFEQDKRRAVFLLQDEQTIVGRRPRKTDIAESNRAWNDAQIRVGNTLCIATGEMFMNRDHFTIDRVIERDGTIRWTVRDMRSSGGIFVNGRRNGDYDVPDIPLSDEDEIATSNSTRFVFNTMPHLDSLMR